LVYNSSSLCKAFNGNRGGNLVSMSTGGSAGGMQLNGTADRTFGIWSTLIGSAGVSGLVNGNPSTAGTPKGTPFSDTNYGCGQRFSGTLNRTATNHPTGVCYITYYLK